ncbi:MULTISPECIES: hypothetical protein [Leptospira]|uniref:Uncharacterized protein n=5 Tax=Leptospira borgpetersenii TaxID=174 RepID=M3HWU5_LEPBO|nr:hypothetical protein [Leptospira borgpetersenii]AXX14597.1 hypothetical protein C4Q31_02500 [Leptospira borgpetersenii serovar Ceylonica]EMG02060.1 hypothetical protein LEP1GSC123_4372 [Leptospira borgpetersenii str. 200701203]EMK08314.1 hypothetical protein LEP1GSC066_1264 [Leptospira sp. serovar Kenya str. Sh9]EMO11950.1 hypothetical protein LEP1GSC137_0827 [Leptospira borgpetersenii str. Noumea 25]EKP12781.1 hypothetical protein LEP1GSC128_3039 [Leptospira borgpetersenii str. 200801926]
MVDFKFSGNPKKENVLRIDLVYFIKKVKLQDSIPVSGQVLSLSKNRKLRLRNLLQPCPAFREIFPILNSFL